MRKWLVTYEIVPTRLILENESMVQPKGIKYTQIVEQDDRGGLAEWYERKSSMEIRHDKELIILFAIEL